MPPDERRLHQNLLPHHLQRVSEPLGLRRLGVRQQVLRTARRHRWHIRHRAHPHCVEIKNRIPDYVISLWLLWQGHNDSSAPDDAHFLARNLTHRIAQKLLMIKRDIRDPAPQRFDHVRRIQPPAHPDLKYSDIDPFPGEMSKCNRRHHFEKTWMPR